MKRILKFGSFSDDFICTAIFISSLLIIFRLKFFNNLSISIESTDMEKLIFNFLIYYERYLEPIILLVWLKFLCEFLFKLLKRD